MDYTNPDNRLKLFLLTLIVPMLLFIAAIWIGDGRFAATAAVFLVPSAITGIWTIAGYETETYEEADQRRAAAKKKLDKHKTV